MRLTIGRNECMGHEKSKRDVTLPIPSIHTTRTIGKGVLEMIRSKTSKCWLPCRMVGYESRKESFDNTNNNSSNSSSSSITEEEILSVHTMRNHGIWLINGYASSGRDDRPTLIPREARLHRINLLERRMNDGASPIVVSKTPKNLAWNWPSTLDKVTQFMLLTNSLSIG